METLLFRRLTNELALVTLRHSQVEYQSAKWINLPQTTVDYAELCFFILLILLFLLVKSFKIFSPQNDRYTLIRIFAATGAFWIVANLAHCTCAILFSYGILCTANFVALRMLNYYEATADYQFYQGLCFTLSYVDTRIVAYCLVVQYLRILGILFKNLYNSFRLTTLIIILSFFSIPLFYKLAPEGLMRNIGCYTLWLLSYSLIIAFPTNKNLIFKYSFIEGAPYLKSD